MTENQQRQPGVMIAMFDIPDSLDDEFNRWYDEEHIPEKVGRVPGFLRARRYRSLDGRPNYLAVYELEDVSVVEDPAYLANYRSATTTTERMKAKAKTFYRNVYVQIGDFHGLPLDAVSDRATADGSATVDASAAVGGSAAVDGSGPAR